MILTGKTIRSLVNDGIIGVSPSPVEEQYQPASLDLRIGSTLYDALTDTEIVDETIRIHPGHVYLGHTVDTVDLPNHLAAMMTGRSSVGRAGVIVHKTAGWVDPGFSGQLTLEMYNFGQETVTFEEGDRVAQLVFIHTDRDSDGYEGQYQDQSGISK